METTIKNMLPNVIEKHEYETYFGKLFKNDPSQFKFFQNQKVIKELVLFRKSSTLESQTSLFNPPKKKIRLEPKQDFAKIERGENLVRDWFKKNMKIQIGKVIFENQP